MSPTPALQDKRQLQFFCDECSTQIIRQQCLIRTDVNVRRNPVNPRSHLNLAELTGMRPSLKWAKLFFSSVSNTFCGTTMNLGRLTGRINTLPWFHAVIRRRVRVYLVDISKRSLTELTLQPPAPHLSSSCSQSEEDSNQFMWASRRRLLRNCFISGGRKWFKHLN